MRKILFFMQTASACLLLYACQNNDGSDSQNNRVQQNIEATRVVNEAFNTGDVSRIDSVVSQDFVDHTEQGDVGRDSLKAMIQSMRLHFPDMKTEVIREVADSTYVFSWMRFTGSSKGDMGMPAGPYDMQAIEVSQLRDGKIIEHWGFMNVQDMVKFMKPTPLAPADSSAVNQSSQ